MSGACAGANSPGQGDGQITSVRWDCLRGGCGHVFENTVRYIYNEELKILLLLLLWDL